MGRRLWYGAVTLDGVPVAGKKLLVVLEGKRGTHKEAPHEPLNLKPQHFPRDQLVKDVKDVSSQQS